MSLEAALKDNTAALLALAAAYAVKTNSAVVVETKLEKAAPAAKAEPQKAPEQPKAEVKAATGVVPPSYEKDIKPIALALAKKDRPKLTAIWAALGVKVGTELKPEQFAQAKQLIEEASK